MGGFRFDRPVSVSLQSACYYRCPSPQAILTTPDGAEKPPPETKTREHGRSGVADFPKRPAIPTLTDSMECALHPFPGGREAARKREIRRPEHGADLVGKKRSGRDGKVRWRRPPDRAMLPNAQPKRQPDLAIREGGWKLLCDYDGKKPRLFHLDVDRGETKNVADSHPRIVEKLTAAVLAWHRSMPPDNGPALAPGKPAPAPGNAQ